MELDDIVQGWNIEISEPIDYVVSVDYPISLAFVYKGKYVSRLEMERKNLTWSGKQRCFYQLRLSNDDTSILIERGFKDTQDAILFLPSAFKVFSSANKVIISIRGKE